jgi:hypothetical protein
MTLTSLFTSIPWFIATDVVTKVWRSSRGVRGRFPSGLLVAGAVVALPVLVPYQMNRGLKKLWAGELSKPPAQVVDEDSNGSFPA